MVMNDTNLSLPYINRQRLWPSFASSAESVVTDTLAGHRYHFLRPVTYQIHRYLLLNLQCNKNKIFCLLSLSHDGILTGC